MICEILQIDANLSNQISLGKNRYEINEAAIKSGYEPMIVDGIAKALEGITTIEEVTRVVKI